MTAAVACAVALLSCSHEAERPVATAATAPDPDPNVRTYVAELTPVNEQLKGRRVTGLAAFSIDDTTGTTRTIVTAKNLDAAVPARVYLQEEVPHAACPTIDADYDANDVVDALETIPYAGAEPVSLTRAAPTLGRTPPSDLQNAIVVVYGRGEDPAGDALDRTLRMPPPAGAPIACGELTRIN